MSTEKFVIAFPNSRNDTRYFNGTNKGADNPTCAIIFPSIEDAEREIEKIKAPLEDWQKDSCRLWIENMEGEIQ